MAINNAKHIVSEINGVRCTIVESGITLERAAFLKDLLSSNNLDVIELQEPSASPDAEPKYTIGVSDLLFNPVFAVYERQLMTPAGAPVTPGYWNQECTDCDPRYWVRRKGARKGLDG
ncbi:MAG TPA: hypothetical protein PL123_10715 [Bacteroidales bacterium]|nr:hypothetical protein [Bacteroidales bacterium]